jgi:hypothetical protein
MSFYRTSLVGAVAGQAVINVLWYRSGISLPGVDLLGFLDAINAEIQQTIWDNGSPGNMRDALPASYTLVSIETVGYADNYELLVDSPVTRSVNQSGNTDANTNGPAVCAILKANLEPAIGPGVGLPKKGYLAIGPLTDSAVQNDGRLASTTQTVMNTLGSALASNIVTEAPPAILYPIRTRVTRVAGIVTYIGYRDVNGFVCRPVAKFRRSRLPEA